MSIIGGLDIHRKQLTFDWVDEQNGKWERGRITPADREHLAGWLTRFDPTVHGSVAFALEGCTGWRYIAEEMAKAGVTAHLAEPADTSVLRGPKRRAKTDKADARLLRELLAAGRLPECYIPPPEVLEWRAMLELYQDLRTQHTGWAQRIQSVCFHQGTTAPGQAGIGSGSARSSTNNCRSPAGCRSTPLWRSWTSSPSTSSGCAAGCCRPPEGSRVPGH
ncbi:IS110 family transposase [Actinoplanes aureus]|uniref:IS110 family transposase n=1 Tax=Actinoplanes aureus TaxID=2792083 RepID=UPI001E367A91|nr:transposase [Actinoplanes aureus]